MLTILVHIILAVILFYLINWMGSQSSDYGYIQLSIFVKTDEAPAFNFLLRSATPVVYIIIASAVFYYLKLDHFVTDIWLVAVYYFIFRAGYNVILGRVQLINWPYQIITGTTSIMLSYILYVGIIKIKTRLLPDFETIANELWIILGLFVYALFNKVKGPSDTTRKRKEKYINGKYKIYKNKYGQHIAGKLRNKDLETLVYAIMLYEAFNRPKIIRVVEQLLFPVFSKSLGIMQINTDKRIDDEKSVILAVEKINIDYDAAKEKLGDSRMANEYLAKRETVAIYNRDYRYVEEVLNIDRMLITLDA